MSLGGRIKQARKAKGLSQAALADDLGVRAHTVYRYERSDDGAIEPRLDTLREIARLCGVEVAWLVAGEGKGPAEGQAA